MRTNTRCAFTLYQLLLVFALFAILLGFLLPAIAKVREAAARSASQNNLKQIGVACHNYASVNRDVLPPGNDVNNYSAHAHLLPYMEQNNLWKAIDFTRPSDAKANAEWRSTRIKTFLSPLDRAPAEGKWGPTNYLFMAGTKPSLANNNGLIYQSSKISLIAVTNADGLSNTIMAVETLRGMPKGDQYTVLRQHVALDAKALKGLKEDAGTADFKQGKSIASDRGGSWMDGRHLQGTIILGRKANDERPDVTCDGQGGWGGPRSHGKTVNVLLGDGSVRAVSVGTTFEVWQAASSYNDGKIIFLD